MKGMILRWTIWTLEFEKQGSSPSFFWLHFLSVKLQMGYNSTVLYSIPLHN